MARKSAETNKNEEMKEPERVADPDTPVEAGAVEAEGNVEELRQRLAEREEEIRRLEEKNKETADQLLRAMADMENVRRRGRMEREEVAQFGLQDFLRDLLPILDNFERALAAENATAESLRQGVELTLRQFQDVLKKHGVEPVPGVGEAFDSSHHEAILRGEPTEEHPAGTVMDEMRKGYLLRGRLLRPSLVKVAQEE